MELKKFNKLKDVIILQLIIVIYTTSGIMAKNASQFKFLSKEFIMFYIFEILILGIYAVLWQQIIKKFDISVAYSNKGISIFWSLMWAVVFFNEKITLNNVIGSIIIITGIMMVSSND